MVAIVGGNPLGFTGPLNASSPYRFDVKIPVIITPGKYMLTASGATAAGVSADSKPIFIDIERLDHPVSIEIEPSYKLDLNVGDRTGLSIIGRYADGSKVYLNKSTETTIISQSRSIVTVNQGLVTAVGPGSTRILINKNIVVQVTVHSVKK